MDWVPDVLDGFEQLTLELAPDDEGDVVATLTRLAPATPIAQVIANLPASAPESSFPDNSLARADNGADVLYIHGWVDYFHQKHLAAFFGSMGYQFYALDLRKYGRSIREWQTPGFTDTLRTYDEDIEAALTAIGHGAPDRTERADDDPASEHLRPPRSLFSHPAGAKREFQPPDDAAESSNTGAIPLVVPAVIRNIIESARTGFATAIMPDDETPSAEESTPSAEERTSAVIPPTARLETMAASAPKNAALPEITGASRKLIVMGHSTGGLIAALWAAYNPGRADALILNSPWLEFQTGNIGRRALEAPIRAQARIAPMSHLVNPDPGFYTKSISNQYEGEWDINPDWKPLVMWPPTAAWMSAIFRGQDRIAWGLDLDIPILVLLSAKSTMPVRWTPELLETDQVITVEDVMARAPGLGQVVTIARIPGALHDVTLSTADVRTKVWQELSRWLTAYV